MSLLTRGRSLGKVPRELPVPEKVKLLKDLEGGATYSELSEKYGVSKTTVGAIQRRKKHLFEVYEQKYKGDKIKQLEKSEHDIIENLVWQFFENNRSNNVPVSKPLIKLKASEMAETLMIKSFKATDKWLNEFCKKRKIDCKEMTAEFEDAPETLIPVDFEEFSSDCTEPLVKIEPEDFTLTIKVEQEENENEEEGNSQEEEDRANDSHEGADLVPSHREAMVYTEYLIKYTNEHYPKYLSVLSELYNHIEDTVKHSANF